MLLHNGPWLPFADVALDTCADFKPELVRHFATRNKFALHLLRLFRVDERSAGRMKAQYSI